MKFVVFDLKSAVLKTLLLIFLGTIYSTVSFSQVVDSNEVTVSDECIYFPELTAFFPGDRPAMDAWMKDNLQYPEESIKYEEQGTVIVEFVIETDGSLSNVKIIRGVSRPLDREAKRLIKAMPKWIPGELGGKKVRTRVQLPIHFIMQ